MKTFTAARLTLGAAALVWVVVATGCSAGAGSNTGTQDNVVVSKETTLKLTTQKVGEAALDHGNSGFTAGDATVRADDVYKDGELVGTGAVDCVTNRIEPIQVQCEVTVILKDGQITWQGIIEIPITESFTLPIVGGTGAYIGVRGEAELTEVSPTSDEITLTFVD